MKNLTATFKHSTLALFLKSIRLPTLFLFLLTLLITCLTTPLPASQKLTPEEAQTTIITEIDRFTSEFLDSQKGYFSDQQKETVISGINEFKDLIEITEIKIKGHSAIAKAKLKVEQKDAITEFKLIKTDSNWSLTAIKAQNGKWIPMSSIFDSFKSNLNTISTNTLIKNTMMDMKAIATAIESYLMDFDEVPQVDNFNDLSKKLIPFYIKQLPLKDAWGSEFFYSHGSGKNNKSYSLASAGTDKIFKGFNQTEPDPNENGKDIILSNGSFVFSPDVK